MWDDKELCIEWPLSGTIPTVSEKDSLLPSFNVFRQVSGGFEAEV